MEAYKNDQNTDIAGELKKTDREELNFRSILIHTVLFLVTVVTVTIQGAEFVGRFETAERLFDVFLDGLVFALLLLFFLGAHEFGHYFAAVAHRVRTSLPYFIPLPFLFIGTFGAVIRIKEPVSNTKKLFDIGIAGPVAGFLVSIFILIYGFITLPGPEYILNFPGHDATKEYVMNYGTYPAEPMIEDGAEVLVMGNTLLFSLIASFFDNVPPMWEMYHYPFLFAGWLGLFFTALNLMPVGQLDGGHILYSLLGYKHHRLFARGFLTVLLMLAGVGAVPVIHLLVEDFDTIYRTLSWSVWALILFMLIYRAMRYELKWTVPLWLISLAGSLILVHFFVGFSLTSGYFIWFVWSLFVVFLSGIEHPPVLYEQPLSPERRVLGWLSMIIFILCISPNPLFVV